jgi:phage-related protein
VTAPSAELLAEAVKPRGTGVWLWLIAIELQTDATESRWVLVTSHSEPVEFAGHTYHPWRVRLPRIESGGPGDLAGARCELSNAGGVAAEYLRQFEGLEGRRIVVRLANSLHLDAAEHALPHTYEIADSQVDAGVAILTLGQLPLHALQCPSRRFARLVCGVPFRGLLCGWVSSQGGDATACDRTLDGPNGCGAHNNVPRFGGQPSMPGTR